MVVLLLCVLPTILSEFTTVMRFLGLRLEVPNHCYREGAQVFQPRAKPHLPPVVWGTTNHR